MSTAYIEDLSELRRLAAQQPTKTRTYRVSADVYRANREALRKCEKMRPLSEVELQEIASYVGLPLARIESICWTVDPAVCKSCGRNMHFVDMVHEAVSIGRHTKEFVADVILGVKGHFITIDGCDDESHTMRCLNCGTGGGKLIQFSLAYDCGTQSYAMCGW
jgi:hypothetical protein